MARSRRRILDVSAPLYVWHDRPINGRAFKRGEVLPSDIGIDPRKVRQLWQQRLLDHDPPPMRPGAVVSVPAARRGRPARPRPQQVTE